MEDAEEARRLARLYLDLWIEHWGACLAAPETLAAMARLMPPFGHYAGGHYAGAAGELYKGAGAEALPAAHDAGDERARHLEERVAALERRLAELGDASHAGRPKPARTARGANRKA